MMTRSVSLLVLLLFCIVMQVAMFQLSNVMHSYVRKITNDYARRRLKPSFLSISSSPSSSPSSSSSLSDLNAFRNIYNEAVQTFTRNNVPDPESSARYLLCDVTKIGYRLSDFNRNYHKYILSDTEVDIFNQYIDRRIQREPVQYIIGNWDFYGLQFICKAPVLIPRPETEELVEKILALHGKKLKDMNRKHKILDIGTGTGAIGISLLSESNSVDCVGIDINAVAVELSQLNYKSIKNSMKGKDCSYQCHHQSFLDYAATTSDTFDLIVSNPPYIPSADIQDLEAEVRVYEDSRALDGGTDGLDIVKDIINHGVKLLKPPKLDSSINEIWLEVSHTHPDKIVQLIASSGDMPRGLIATAMDDLSGNPRFVRIQKMD